MAVKPPALASSPKGPNGHLEESRGVPIPQKGSVPHLALAAISGTLYGSSPPQRDASPLSARVASSFAESAGIPIPATGSAISKMMPRQTSLTNMPSDRKGRSSLTGEPPRKPSPKEATSSSPTGARPSPPGIMRSITSPVSLVPEVPSDDPSAIVRKRLEYLLSLPTEYSYHVKKAELQLYVCTHNYLSEFNRIIDVLVEVRIQAIQQDRYERMQELLQRMMLRPENVPILIAYFKKTREDFSAFIAKALPFLTRKKISDELTVLSSHYTREDLKTQSPETLFREDCPSSFFCRELGNYLWSKELKTLSETVQRELRKHDLTRLCLNRNQIAERLKESHTLSFDAATDFYINETLTENVKHFSGFATQILPSILLMNIPKGFMDLLKTRRLDIMRFLPPHDTAAKTSRVYIGELLCQRILVPQILKFVDKEKHPEGHAVLVSLTKVINKCLSGEPQFDVNDGAYPALNSLVLDFKEKFQFFIDSASLERV